jgi:TM2 domain-containing membrane protein YozV
MYEKNPKKRDESADASDAAQPPAPAGEPAPDGGAAAPESAPPPPPAGAPPDAVAQAKEKKVVAGILGIVLGSLGIHKFYLGYTNEGLILLLVTVVGGGIGGAVTCGLLAPVAFVPAIIGVVEGILYLTKSDEEFAASYIVGRKGWF